MSLCGYNHQCIRKVLNLIMKTKFYKLLITIDNKIPVFGKFIRKIYKLNTFRIFGINNKISYDRAKLSAVTFNIKGRNNNIEIEEGSILNNVTFNILGDNHRISIGKNCEFRVSTNIYLEDRDCELRIDNNSTFQAVIIALTEPGSKIYIGKDCMLAYDIEIRNGDSHSIISNENKQRINYAKNIYIGNHVWVAAHCVILKGVSIAENSIVAIGSIVTKAFEEKNIIIAGNPAKKIKENISWTRERTYNKTDLAHPQNQNFQR